MGDKPKPAVRPWLWIVLVIIVVAGAGFFAWFYLMGPGKASTTTTTATKTPTPSKTATKTTTDEWLTYTNETYGYSIKYPPSLTYVEQDATKNMYFQTAADKAAIADCASRPETDCTGSSQIKISVDVNAGTTDDETGKSLSEIVAARQKALLSTDAAAATLGGQSAYEGVINGLTTYYDLFAPYNGHVYDLMINCDSAVTATCKSAITSNMQKMIDSFTFL